VDTNNIINQKKKK